MKQLPFHKYHGTGNDFILIEDPDGLWEYRLSQPLIEALCARHTGIGADGLMLLQRTAGYDFRMVYYNSDGRESSFCGNGSRCLVAFAHSLGWIGKEAWFVASDGDHEARVLDEGLVSVHMKSIARVHPHGLGMVLDSGSPHYVTYVQDVDAEDLIHRAREIRYAPEFAEEGINVNLMEEVANGLKIRTYERGVENETLSCGTGVTASAIVWAGNQHSEGTGKVHVHTRGGELTVNWERGAYGFRNIWLTGPTKAVFTGIISLPT
ncbi:MAG: diaminopimelate epimerase [Saprospiraceae bacterium]|nr:diaminopimelate epimerase [Saprospiraceae bacterium]